VKTRVLNAIKSFFVYDIGTKVLSLAIAFLLWTYVDSVNTAEHTVHKVPIVLELPEGLTLVQMTGENNEAVRAVSLTMRGPKGHVEEAKLAAITCAPRLDITPEQVGEEITTDYSLSSADFNVRGGLSLSFAPSRLRLTVAALREEDVDVTAENCLTGKPSRGYELAGEPVIEPSQVRVRGPARAFNGPEKKIKTANIPLDNKSADFSKHVQLSSKWNGVPVATEKTVLVRVSIRPVPVTEVLEKVPVHVLAPGGTNKRSFTVEPQEVPVTIQGSRRAVDEFKKEYLKKELFFAYVDATNQAVRMGTKIPVAFYLSPKVSKDIIVRDTNVQVTLKIEEEIGD
jgi:YbbR domain-containing protein